MIPILDVDEMWYSMSIHFVFLGGHPVGIACHVKIEYTRACLTYNGVSSVTISLPVSISIECSEYICNSKKLSKEGKKGGREEQS